MRDTDTSKTENYTSPNAPAKPKPMVLEPGVVQLQMGTQKAELPKKPDKGQKKVK